MKKPQVSIKLGESAISAYQCFVEYTSLKAHFNTPRYDYFKYKGLKNSGLDHFNKRSDRKFFEFIAGNFLTRSKVVKLFLSNMVKDPNIWIGDLATDEAKHIFDKWMAKVLHVRKNFEEDVVFLYDAISDGYDLERLFCPHKMQLPGLIVMLERGDIYLESFILLEDMLHFFSSWDADLENTIIWPELRKRCIKYRPFLFRRSNPIDYCRNVLREYLPEVFSLGFGNDDSLLPEDAQN